MRFSVSTRFNTNYRNGETLVEWMEKQPNTDEHDGFDGNVAYPDEVHDNHPSRSSTASSSRWRIKWQSEDDRQIPRLHRFLSVESLDSQF